MIRTLICRVLYSVLLILASFADAHAGPVSSSLQSRLDSANAGEEFDIIITLADKVNLREIPRRTKRAVRSSLIRALKDKAQSGQIPLRQLLKSREAKKIVPLWIFNGIAATARAEVIRELAAMPGIESIKLDGFIELPRVSPSTPSLPEWNLEVTGAPGLWDQGYSGQGITVANMDTGVDLCHPDLESKWRGGCNSWFDPAHQHEVPYDRDGHGTQTMGIMVGGSEGGTAIGTAPGAKWIAVKVFDDAGRAAISRLHLGLQWLLDPDGDNTTDDAPDVVNCSWGFNNEFSEYIPEFRQDIEALKAAGIAVVFAAGNSGPGTSTDISPANYPECIAVGAIDDNLGIAPFSSRGPSNCKNGVYPDVIAPGVSVKTTDLTFNGLFPGSYTNVTGTSFAAPHVSGAMALLLSAFPDSGIPELEDALRNSAIDLGPSGPDDDCGYGLIDIQQAYELLLTSEHYIDLDHDGYSIGAECGECDCNDGDPSIHPGALETKHDGIDQDCNGHDLTIDILKADCRARTLRVEAVSALGKAAMLKLQGYGPMTWNRFRKKWTITVRVPNDPGTVTVVGMEGSESARTNMKRI